MKRLSLLAPARDIAVAKAAIQAGADAVYIGPPQFGARQAAGNTIESIHELVEYARPYGVDILVTLNTLLTDTERKEAVQMAWQLYEAGVSALIIQDMQLLKENLPPIRLHASTQCDNRTPEQVQQLQALGFRRVVLARELGIDEIKAISATHTPIELEAFIHGALCVSYSGRCYLSEVLMNRSANRGCCAQLCRQRYDLLDENMQEVLDANGLPIHQRYLLSLQDLDRSLYLKELIDAGVTTFKIEGRLKDAEYVTNIVAYYRQKLDAIITQSDGQLTHSSVPSQYRYGFIPNPEKTFHRGQTDYFLHGRGEKMACWTSPKSTGEYVGTVTRVLPREIELRLAQNITLHNGDGLCYQDKGFAVNGIEGNRIRPNQKLDIRPGETIYRNLDAEFQRNLWAERRLPLWITFEETEDGFRLTAKPFFSHTRCESPQSSPIIAEKKEGTCLQVSYPHESAKNPERALQTLREQLQKLGDTPYYAAEVNIESAPYFIPISLLNQWRRDLIQRL